MVHPWLSNKPNAAHTRWHQHGDEHIHVLLNYTTKQRELHQQDSFQQETEENRQWLTQATQKGCRGLFRTLKKDELPYLRPFQDLPRGERMPKRVQQWGDIWQIQDQPVLIACMEQMIQKGQAAAQQLPPLTEAQIWYTIKQLAALTSSGRWLALAFLSCRCKTTHVART